MDKPAPDMVATGCDAAPAGVSDAFSTVQLAVDAAGAGGVVNVMVAAGVGKVDGACCMVVAPMDAGDPLAVTGEPATE
ncbi:hypothetical protein [Burkholderia stabilis]|uniref:hypothetical protein n=1 Tax=Burkholderia stabilis TaxID=95485 RepID=UPI003B985614